MFKWSNLNIKAFMYFEQEAWETTTLPKTALISFHWVVLLINLSEIRFLYIELCCPGLITDFSCARCFAAICVQDLQESRMSLSGVTACYIAECRSTLAAVGNADRSATGRFAGWPASGCFLLLFIGQSQPSSPDNRVLHNAGHGSLSQFLYIS